jgi:hypothetical protein
MLREYIKKIEIIKSGVIEESSARPSIRFEDKAKTPQKLSTALTAGAENARTQHPVKVISVFIAGLILVVLIGSYFYYQTGQKETKTIKLVQNKPVRSEKILSPQAPEPMDQTAKTNILAQETQKTAESSSDDQQISSKEKSVELSPDASQTVEMAPVEGDGSLIPAKGNFDSTNDGDTVKGDVQKEVAAGNSLKKDVPVAENEDTLRTIVPEPLKEKATDIEVTEIHESETVAKASPVTDDGSLISEKGKPDDTNVEKTPRDDAQKEVMIKTSSAKTAPADVGEDTLTTIVTEPLKEKAIDIDVKEGPESKFAPKSDSIAADVSLVSKKQMPNSLNVEDAVKDDVQKAVDAEGVKEKEVSDGTGKDTLTVAVPETGVKKVLETEVKPFLNESQKKMEQVTSGSDINRQKNELSRLKSFLDEYCQAYTNKDLDKFITFFTSDATENQTPFHEMLPDYRKKLERMESLTYRIELLSYSKQSVSENLMVRGRFFARYKTKKGNWEENNGSIFMELLESGDSFLVKQLNYRE